MENRPHNANGAFRSKHGFTVIQNDIIRDRTVSLKAKGLYLTIQAYITLPGKNWLKSEFMSMVAEGEKAFNSAWNELKKAGYLKTHTYPKNGSWCHEYELLDEPQKGPHTFYYDAKGNLTKNNEEISKSSSDESNENRNEEPEQHTPLFGSSANGVGANGISADGISANSTSISINTNNKSFDTNPSINPDDEDGMNDIPSDPIMIDVSTPIDENTEREVLEKIRVQGELPSEWAFDSGKMLTAIQILTGWNARIADKSNDTWQVNAYAVVLGALTEMCTSLKSQKYGNSTVSYSHVIKRLNALLHGKNGVWELDQFVSACMDRLIEAEKTQTIKNPVAYAKTLIWNNFVTYKLDFEGYFHRSYYGALGNSSTGRE